MFCTLSIILLSRVLTNHIISGMSVFETDKMTKIRQCGPSKRFNATIQSRSLTYSARKKVNSINSGKIVNRVRQGFENLKMLQPHPRVTQLLGYCIAGNITVMITELGTWGDLRQFLLTNTFKEFSMAQRTDIALQVNLFQTCKGLA